MEIDYGDANKDDTNLNKGEEEVQESNSGNDILQSDIPAQEWQREVEKVSNKLKWEVTSNHPIGEWRGHIEQIKSFDGVIFF